MTEFTHRIDIKAPRKRVWGVMADIPRWPEWTPTVSRVEAEGEGPVGVGSRFRLHQPKLRPATWEITDWTPGSGFAWVSRAPGLTSRGEHLAAEAEGRTIVTLRVTFEGLLAPVVAFLAGRMTSDYIRQEAEGLKKRAELPSSSRVHES